MVLVFSPFLRLTKNIIQRAKNAEKTTKKNNSQEFPRAPRHSTTFFHHRVASAFPGIRKVTWFENPKEAIKRLEILLNEPIKFVPKTTEFASKSIWWFRGGSALYIEEFKKISRKIVLMNFDQLKIKRIAAYHSSTYYKDFVYVEVEGEKQTGLYNFSEEDIKRHIDSGGYSWEEYGVIKNKIGWQV